MRRYCFLNRLSDIVAGSMYHGHALLLGRFSLGTYTIHIYNACVRVCISYISYIACLGCTYASIIRMRVVIGRADVDSLCLSMRFPSGLRIIHMHTINVTPALTHTRNIHIHVHRRLSSLNRTNNPRERRRVLRYVCMPFLADIFGTSFLRVFV